MSSFRKTVAGSGKDKEGDDSDKKDRKSWNPMPSSNQKKKTRSVAYEVFEDEINSENANFYLPNFQNSKYKNLYKEDTESESEPSSWMTNVSYQRGIWSSESEVLAGTSRMSNPQLEDMQIVTEVELDQLAQVRPFIFTSYEQSTINEYIKTFQKKVIESEINEEFLFDIWNIVAQMREQRRGMIQTKEQYCFCFKIVLEVLKKLQTVK
ncbi:tyrosine-protein phosphatase non-receptor type 20 isoform X5 [Talpa occidentalis]|uniref:tyrosine-protein phosphatase non-receptor type 20 isoform X5 n=1 Tax=Talpa occidentalis TaxID=50954 RepID=UPI00188E090A|nr:tyrosine-protein phosphatase non-receptor type 20 isoform X5 [Talpa occidentalis]